MKKVFLHQLRKNLWFDVAMLGVWEFFIIAEEDGFCLFNLYLLIVLTCVILFRCLIAPKLLYWFRRSQILCRLNQARENPETTVLEMDLLIVNIEYIKIPTIELEDALDLYPKDIEKLKRLTGKYK